ncbi:MAG: hypothetical protein ABIH35_00765 [Patescibacteria group bacterium]
MATSNKVREKATNTCKLGCSESRETLQKFLEEIQNELNHVDFQFDDVEQWLIFVQANIFKISNKLAQILANRFGKFNFEKHQHPKEAYWTKNKRNLESQFIKTIIEKNKTGESSIKVMRQHFSDFRKENRIRLKWQGAFLRKFAEVVFIEQIKERNIFVVLRRATQYKISKVFSWSG